MMNTLMTAMKIGGMMMNTPMLPGFTFVGTRTNRIFSRR